mgnify:CR=1 FL=1
MNAVMVASRHSNSLWIQVVERFRSDRTGMGSLLVVGLFFVLVVEEQPSHFPKLYQ